jgi:transcriptional regulator with XRE-family HTH domain
MAICLREQNLFYWWIVSLDLHQKQVLQICRKLKSVREEKGLSQQRLSEMAAMSRTGLRHVESGQISPTLYSLLKICAALEVDIACLLQETVNPSVPLKNQRKRA